MIELRANGRVKKATAEDDEKCIKLLIKSANKTQQCEAVMAYF